MGTVDEVVSAVKKAYQVSQKLHDAELQGVVADLMLKVAELKGEMANIQEKNSQLRQQLDELKCQADIRSKLEL